MALGPHLWSAKTWLGPAAPLFTMPAAIAEVLVGLDRVYLRSAQGPLVAIDAFARIAERHPTAILIVAGDGPQLPACRTLAARLGNRVQFLGQRDDVIAVL